MTPAFSKQEKKLASNLKHLGLTTEEQIEKNQAAIALIRSWQNQQLTQEELEKAEINWEKVKEIIDENRSRKLFD